MSEHIKIAAEPRQVTGKKVKQLRREGLIPAVIYGRNEPVNIQLDNLVLRRVLRDAGGSHLIDIDMNGGSLRTVLAREIQAHPTRGDLIHVDFVEVDLKVKLTADASLVLVGESAPQTDGLGSTMLMVQTIQIECLPDNLVSEIEVDASKIATPEDVIYVSELTVPEGVEILTDPETMIAKFEYRRAEAVEEEEGEELLFGETADEVEVIGRGKEDEGEDSE
jgi:large subunit ribosomal protein L25